MKMNELKKAVNEEAKSQKGKALKHLEELESIEEKEKYIKSWIYSKSLNAVYKKAQAKTEAQKKQALKKLIALKYEAVKADKIAKIEKADQLLNSGVKLENIEISIEWKKSTVWGYNPHAKIDFYIFNGVYHEFKTFTGSASGCGYDKRSAAIAEAFNKCDILKALLYQKENERLKKAPEKARRDYIGYGAGYGALPYIEGGVGFGAQAEILKNLGFKNVCFNESNKHFDFYLFNISK